MTDKEQALVAAAYRVAAGVCDEFQERAVGMQPAECAGAIRALTPADAANHLRALMTEVAFSVASSAYTDAEVEQIVDEVLNGLS